VGEKQNQPFQLSFNPCLKVDFQGSRVTSDGGLLLVRELDERLGLSALITHNIMEDRRCKNTQLPLPDLLRQSIYSRLAGYEDLNDAERLSQDPTFRLIGSEKIWDRGAALPSRLHWFETEVLTQEENLDGLSRINRELLAKAEAMDSPQRVVLDMDSTEVRVYGEQEQSAYNGHFESTCYHPLVLFNGEGDCLAAKLLPGNLHSAEDWEEVLLPEVERQQELGKEVVFRADAAFAKPEIYEAMEERGVKYAIRLPANDNLLAVAGGRTPAAVRGDARPDRAAPGTDGIDGQCFRLAAESYTEGWSKKKRCRNNGPQIAQFRLCWYGSHTDSRRSR